MNQSFELEERIQKAVKEYAADIIRFAFMYVKNIYDAEDIAQEVFLRLLLKNPVFKDRLHEKAWLLKVTSNKCKDYLRSGWHTKRTGIRDDLTYIPEETGTLLQEVLSLENKYRIPIFLHYYNDLPINEIAQILKENPSTVGTRLQRGREKLKANLGDEYFE